MNTAIWWIRRDLRLIDNVALTAALAHGESVVPAFILDPAILGSSHIGPKRVAFLMGGLRQLDADLRLRGSRLIVRSGVPREELRALVSETGASAIYATADFSPYARERDADVARHLPVRFVDGPTLRDPDDVLKADGTPYTVFTPFSHKWRTLPLPADELLPAPARLDTPLGIAGLPIPTRPAASSDVPFVPGEAEALRRLEAFVAGAGAPISAYASTRDDLAARGTSMLSPYLRFGMLSPRQVVLAALRARDSGQGLGVRRGADVWLDELIWREFFVAVLYHFPQALMETFRENLRTLAWENDDRAFEAWCAGRTGYPAVDAAMRQLVSQGWVHNRARLLAGSFLVKDLLVDWRWGEEYFRQHLIDGDPAANSGNWQWVAGTGTDAAPYFRVFNPVAQGRGHDPTGAWVRAWIPELSRFPDRLVHEPWKASVDEQRDAACVIGADYPAPIVDHAWARERALAVYRAAARAASPE